MKILLQKKVIFLPIILVFLVFIISYLRVPFLFFQQDEMLGFGLFVKEGSRIILRGLGVGDIIHFVPVTMGISYYIFRLFGLSYWVYNSFAIIFHLVNGILVYKIAKKLLKKKALAIISILIFFSSNVAAQFLMWPVINLNSLALTFSLIIWFMLVDKKTFPKINGFLRGLVISLFLLLALFSVEYSAGLIFFIPSIILLRKGESINEKMKILTPFIMIVFTYLLLRFIPILQGPVFIADSPGNGLFLVRVFNLVARYFGQLLLGQSFILFLSKIGQTFAGLSDLGIAYAENFLFPIISEIAGIVLFVFSAFVYLRLKGKKPVYARGFLLCVLFIVFSSLPFLLVPGGIGLSSVIASRYMYFGLAGMAICVAYIYDILISYFNKKVRFILLVIILLIISIGTYSNYRKSVALYLQGRLRVNILETINKSYSTLPVKVIFYTESDTSFYGLPPSQRILPFQSGFGQTLLIFYSQYKTFPKNFYPGDYLWNITSQGYREFDGRGFGYFRDFELMAKIVAEKGIPIDSVIAFRYDSSNQKVEDMSVEVRGRLAGYAAKKKEIPLSSVGLDSSLNSKDIHFLRDDNRATFWDSKLSYMYPQFVEVTFNTEKKIAQIQIDSYNNKDQNEVGYKVSLLGDDGIWHQVFYSKRYPPNENGIVNLYFEPQATLRVKIEQVGYHATAPWVIHELKVYEEIN